MEGAVQQSVMNHFMCLVRFKNKKITKNVAVYVYAQYDDFVEWFLVTCGNSGNMI